MVNTRVSGCLICFIHVKNLIAVMVALLFLGSDRKKKLELFQKKSRSFLHKIFFLSPRKKTYSLLILDLARVETSQEKVS